MKSKHNQAILLLPIMGLLAMALAGCANRHPSASKQGASSGGGRCKLGIDVLASNGFAPLRGKRVGLVTNQTSVNGRGTKTRLVLHRSKNVNLTALYVPEHGLDGEEPAGRKVSSRRDPLTGLPAYSLYGATRKPSPSMLKKIDTMVFDLQDIGSRSYTYISTMALCMEACGEQGKLFMVLDRPNPLGGLRVDGPPLEKKWTSFVGQIPVPYVHGMTAGELARMLNGERWMKAGPKLMVVPMKGWSRNMVWRDTRLRYVATSPNIPRAESPFYYVTTGMLGGLHGVDIGIGSSKPFQYAAGEGINPQSFSRHMNSLGFQGVKFTPFSSRKKPGYGGVEIHVNPRTSASLVELDVTLISEINRRCSGKNLLRRTPASTFNLFHKVYGSDSLYRQLKRGVSPKRIAASWQGNLNSFRARRAKYFLYQ